MDFAKIDGVNRAINLLTQGLYERNLLQTMRGLQTLMRSTDRDDPVTYVYRLTELLFLDHTHQCIKEKIAQEINELLLMVPGNDMTGLVTRLNSLVIDKSALGGPELDFYVKASVYILLYVPSAIMEETYAFLRLSNAMTHQNPEIAKRLFKYIHGKIAFEPLANLFKAREAALSIHATKDFKKKYRKTKVIIDIGNSDDEFSAYVCIFALKNLLMLDTDEEIIRKAKKTLFKFVHRAETRPVAIRAYYEIDRELNGILTDELKTELSRYVGSSDPLTHELIQNKQEFDYWMDAFCKNWVGLAGISQEIQQRMLERYEKDVANLPLVKLEARDCSVNSQPKEITEKLDEFLISDSTKILILKGQEGSGKTTSCKIYAMNMLKYWHDYLPIYGHVNHMNNPYQLFAEECFYNAGIDQTAVKDRPLLFIIDGHDELRIKENIIESNNFFGKFCNCKLIIVSDPSESFRHLFFFVGDIPDCKMNMELEITPLNTESRVKLLTEYSSPHIPEQLKVFETPLLIELFSKSSQNFEDINKFIIFSNFVNSSHTEIYIQLALTQYKYNKIAADESILQLYGAPGSIIVPLDESLRYFVFCHYSFVRYFISLKIKQTLEDSSLDAGFLNEIICDDLILSFTDSFIQKDHRCALLKLLKKANPHKLASLNAMKIIKQSRIPLADSNLCDLDLEDLDLSSMKLNHVNLRGSSLKNINVVTSDLFNTNLLNTNLLGMISDENEEHFTLPSSSISLSISPNGRFLASDTAENAIIIWDTYSMTSVLSLVGHLDIVNSLDFSKDGRFLASGSADTSVKVWKIESGSNLFTLEYHRGHVRAVVFSSDGLFLASGGYDREVIIWDLQTQQVKVVLKGHRNCVNCLQFAKNDKMLASGSLDMSIKLWETRTGVLVYSLRQYVGFINCLVCSHDSQYIISGNSHGDIIIWQLETGECVNSVRSHHAQVRSLDISANGRYLLSAGNDEYVRVYDFSIKRIIYSYRLKYEFPKAALFSLDASRIVIQTNNIIIKPIDLTREQIMFDEDTNYVSALTFSPDGKCIISGDYNSKIKIRDIESGKTVCKFSEPSFEVYSLCISRDSKFLVASGKARHLCVWDLETQSLSHKLSGHNDYVYSVDISSISQMIVSGSKDQTVKIWQDKSLLYTIRSDRGIISSVAFSPDESLIAVATGEVVLVYESLSETVKTTYARHNDNVSSVKFSPNGLIIASSSWDWGVHIWETYTKKMIHRIENHLYNVTCLAFSPDGRFLASGGYDKIVLVWDFETKKTVHCFQGHDDFVSCVVFSPDSKFVASASGDSQIKIWKVKSNHYGSRHALDYYYKE